MALGTPMEEYRLPQSTIEYLNNGAPTGEREKALLSAAEHYRDGGIEIHIAIDELAERAELDGLTMRQAESMIRRVYKQGGRASPPRAESFHAGRKGKSRGRTAARVMHNRNVPEALPPAIEDPVRTLLRVAFSPGEYLYFQAPSEEGEPENTGHVLIFEQCMHLLEASEGDAIGLPGTNDLGGFVGINPLRRQTSTRRNSEILDLRHTLVEFEDIPLCEQWALMEASRLPITAVIHSGGKSLHAWVRVDAGNLQQYEHAVSEIHQFFEGYHVDGRNRNPSRLSRLAGAARGKQRQDLLAINIGQSSFEAWKRWKDREPAIMSWNQIDQAELPKPALLIDNMLHRGSKMTIGGGSKSMKSWALADLAVSVSTGQQWWGNDTVKGGVLLIDFELDRYFWRERVRSIITEKGGPVPDLLDVLPMRGRMADFEMVRRYVMEACDRKDYSMIILDPIYKCLGGRDENAAGDVADLMNEVESLTLDTGAAVVIAAHYSKGNQAAKDSLDRISGSGVFARDPDTILAMTKHEDEGSFTVDVTVRNFEPIAPFVVSWRWPLMQRNKELNPDDIKLPKVNNPNQPKVTVADFVREFRGVAAMPKDELKDKVMEVFNIGKSKWYELFKQAEKSGQLQCVCGLYKIREDSN